MSLLSLLSLSLCVCDSILTDVMYIYIFKLKHNARLSREIAGSDSFSLSPVNLHSKTWRSTPPWVSLSRDLQRSVLYPEGLSIVIAVWPTIGALHDPVGSLSLTNITIIFIIIIIINSKYQGTSLQWVIWLKKSRLLMI